MQKLWTIAAVLVAVSFLGLGTLKAEDDKKKGKRKRPSPEQIIKKLDTDKNGTLSVEEFLKSPRIKDEAKGKAIFKRWDANENGQVCAKELGAALKKMRKAHKKGDRKKGDRKKGDRKKGEHKKGEHKKAAAKKECPKKAAAKKECSKKKKD